MREPAPPVALPSAGRAYGLGLLTGLQAAVIGVLLVTVPTVLAFVTTSGSPATAALVWSDAAGAGVRIWLLAHGAVLVWSGGGVSLLPLGLTALMVACVALSVRVTPILSWAGTGGLVTGYAAIVIAAGAMPSSIGVGAWPRLLVGTLVVVGLGIWLTERHEGPIRLVLTRARRALPTFPPAVAAGARGAVAAARWQFGLGLLAVVVTLVAHSRALAVGTAQLGPDPVGAVILVLAQLAYLPAACAWATAFLAGPGFAIGGGVFGSFAVHPAPLPAVPALTALPEQAWSRPLSWLAIGALLVVGFIGCAAALRRRPPGSWGERFAALATTSLVAGGLWLAVALLASGTIGRNDLQAGPILWPFVGQMALLGLGASALALGWVALRPPAAPKAASGTRRRPGTGSSPPSGTAARNRRPPSR